MKRLILVGFAIACIVAFLMILHGCAPPIVPDQFRVTISPEAGHPPFEATITATERTGKYIYQPTGQEAVESTENTFSVTVDTWPWKCPVTWIDGDSVATATAQPRLVNERPVAHDLWLSSTNPGYGEVILADLRYLQHGCLNGMPLSYSGISDADYNGDEYSADNDGFTYNVKVQDVATGNWESVYSGPDRTLVGDSFTTNPIFYWSVGLGNLLPPYPYLPWSPLSIKDCLLDPGTPPVTDTPTIEKRVEVTVKEFGDYHRYVYSVMTFHNTCSTP